MKQDIQAVILAAGKGTRMLPLTETRPKPMQMVLGKNLIEWKLEALPEAIKDVIIVIGHQGEQIRDYFGDSWNGKPIRYAVQEELNGTAGALWTARDLIGDRFVVLMGDDLYGADDVRGITKHEWAIGGYPVLKRETGGEIAMGSKGEFAWIKEDKHYVERGYVSTNLFMLKKEIFTYNKVIVPGRTEFGLPHTLLSVAMHHFVPIVEVKHWFQITTSEDLQKAEKFVLLNKGYLRKNQTMEKMEI